MLKYKKNSKNSASDKKALRTTELYTKPIYSSSRRVGTIL